MSATDSFNVFSEAQESFLESLSPKERSLYKPCSSAEELLKSLQSFDTISSNQRRLRRSVQQVRRFSDSLAPYFDAIGFVVQSHPEVAAITWGIVRLVLQLASNFSTFFEKLASSLDRLSLELPIYSELTAVWTDQGCEPAPRIRESLCRIYTDLIQFFRAVSRIFCKKDGTKRKTSIVILDLFWKPYDARFSEVIQNMRIHRDILSSYLELQVYRNSVDSQVENARERVDEAMERLKSSEARLIGEKHLELTKKMREDHERSNRENLIARIRKWISPPQFAEELERAQDLREDGTGVWLFQDQIYKTWFKQQKKEETKSALNNAIWVQGNPGCGKTVLAASVTEELQDLVDSRVCYFFFRHETALGSALAAYRALIAQIFQGGQRDQLLLDRFAFAMDEGSSGQLIVSKDELVDLFQFCMQIMNEKWYVVLDGIDECDDSEVLVNGIIRVTRGTSAKLLLFSRPNVASLDLAVPKHQRLPIGQSNSKDIARFLSRKLELLWNLGLFGSGYGRSKLVSQLTLGADGMFLWAHLMIEYLKSTALQPYERINIILEISNPEGLETMYTRIWNLICRGNKVERKLAIWIIKWLAFAERRLTSRELQDSIKVMDAQIRSTVEFTDFDRTVIDSCASLVERVMINDSRYEEAVPCYRFIHLSAREYFTTSNTTTKHKISPSDSHLDISRSCLRYLTYCIPPQPLSGRPGRDVISQRLDEVFPLHRYALLNWLNHLGKFISSLVEPCALSAGIPGRLSSFEEFQLAFSAFILQGGAQMAWIEASFVFEGNMKIQEFEKWVTWARSNDNPYKKIVAQSPQVYFDATEYVGYLKRLQDEWGVHLMKTPVCIWSEVTAFTPSRMLLQTASTQVDTFSTATTNEEGLSSRPLARISEVDTEGSFIGILSIWPSRIYENAQTQYAQPDSSLSSGITCASVSDLHDSWLARYEIWSIAEESLKIIDLKVQLEPDEVKIQMQQSLWRDQIVKKETNAGAVELKLQFPISISPDVRSFTVLRTIYVLEEEEANGLKLHTSTVSMDLNMRLAQNWTLRPGSTESERFNDEMFYEYLYWMYFSPDGKKIFFIDNEFAEPSTIAVFELRKVGALSVSLVNAQIAHITGFDEKRHGASFSFHPNKSLIAFAIADTVFVWAFSSDRPESLCRLQRAHTDFTPELNFSSCGEHIVIKYTPSGNPTVQSLYSLPGVFVEILGEKNIVQMDATSPGTLAKSAENLSAPRPTFKFASNAVIRGHSSELTSTGHWKFVSTNKTSENVTVTMAQEGPDACSTSKFELTKLPNWEGITKTRVSVKLPKTKDELVKVVLNKTANRWSDLSDTGQEHFPAVIRRVPKTIRSITPEATKILPTVRAANTNQEDSFTPPYSDGCNVQRSTVSSPQACGDKHCNKRARLE